VAAALLSLNAADVACLTDPEAAARTLLSGEEPSLHLKHE
jgi:hypothetical protein